MNFEDFRNSLVSPEPPSKLSRALAALWWDAKQDWRSAHECAQEEETSEGAWLHAYLHRKEGDHNNAAYWYGRAGKPVCHEPAETEWLQIAQALLE